jgi:hypothetical protein
MICSTDTSDKGVLRVRHVTLTHVINFIQLLSFSQTSIGNNVSVSCMVTQLVFHNMHATA